MKMAMKAALAMALCLCVANVVLMVAADDDTYQAVLTTDGTNVVFGANNTYTIESLETGIKYHFRFYFGLGYTGDTVLTDTEVTMGTNGDASRIYVCNDEGELELVDSSSTPQNAVIRVQFDSTDNSYQLQITEASPPVYVQIFMICSTHGIPSIRILCTAGTPGTRIRFTSSPNPTGPLAYEWSLQDMQHQVVDG